MNALEEFRELPEEEQNYRFFLELCKRMFERMERENSWPWLDDPEGWNEAHPDHQVTPEELALNTIKQKQPEELRQERLF